jgi:hypothetical protein
MNLLELLKQFKNIEPNPAFKEQSKRAVLASAPAMAVVPGGWGTQRTIWKIIETAAAVALTGFFVLLITGSLSDFAFSPVQYSAIDPQSLHAEAQAIDMQIQLANLNYTEPSAATQSTVQIAGAKPGAPAAVSTPLMSASGTAAIASSTTVTNATGTVSVDQALQSLAQ